MLLRCSWMYVCSISLFRTLFVADPRVTLDTDSAQVGERQCQIRKQLSFLDVMHVL